MGILKVKTSRDMTDLEMKVYRVCGQETPITHRFFD